mmetsp:Transcript_17367/g.70465  ORF Transcript_17367/g.70465 Transcript_17367/m.70465 type:complete len:187 (-) Transcript_17367:426-986(-)
MGADLVIHSGTKYLAGHNDLLCGALAGRADLVADVRALHGVLGGVVDPHAAYLLLRGMKTLDLRIEQQNRTAEKLAAFLQHHPKISRVWYPTIPDHPDYETAKKQECRGWGGVLSFEVITAPAPCSEIFLLGPFCEAGLSSARHGGPFADLRLAFFLFCFVSDCCRLLDQLLKSRLSMPPIVSLTR